MKKGGDINAYGRKKKYYLGGNDGRKGRNMFNINDAVGWIGNVAVFIDHEGGYILVDWPFGWKRMHIH